MSNKETLSLEFKTPSNEIQFVTVDNPKEIEKIISERALLGEIFYGIKDVDSILGDIDRITKSNSPPIPVFTRCVDFM